ncbi:MAG: hypothetical protein NC489_08210 [Ruminococcus flavefaciens]|nr:hypothetical protein [Ruminococcus flavefaciens]
MAIVKYRLQNADSNAVHLETSADIVKCSDGTSVETALAGKSPTSHSHSGYVPTTRKVNGKALSADVTLSASDVGAAASSHTHAYAATNHTHSEYVPTTRTIAGKPLSANISADDLKTALGVTGGSPTITAPTYPASVPAVGNTMSWAGKTWRVVHKLSGVAILALEYFEKNIVWSNVSNYYTQEYIGSNIYNECMTFANTLKLFAADYIIPFGGLPCFIPSYDQVNGGFSYWATQANRIFKNSSGAAQTFWTCTVFCHSRYGYGFAGFVDADGALDNGGNVGYSLGFRPCVALRL